MNECFPQVLGRRPVLLISDQDFTRKPVMGDVLGIGGGNVGQAIMWSIRGVSAGAHKIGQKAIGFIYGPGGVVDELRLTLFPLCAESLPVRQTEGPDLQV